MGYKYSDKLLDAVLHVPNETRTLGQLLALWCITAKLPATYVAQVLGVTRMTVHLWFRGGPMSERKTVPVKAFIKILEGDTARGILPAKTPSDARAYLQEMTTKPLTTAHGMGKSE